MNALTIRIATFGMLTALAMSGCGGGGAGGANISIENVKKISMGMKLADAEKLIGAPGTRLSELHFNAFSERRRGVLQKTPPGATRYLWQEANAVYYVDVNDAGGNIVGSGRFAGSK